MAAVTQYYSKWDKFAAELSDDEPAAPQAPVTVVEAPDVVGKGQALTEDGRIQAGDRPGNGRGNRLGGNAPPPREWPLQQYTWTDAAGVVTVNVPLPHLARKTGEATCVESVTCSFGPYSLDLRVVSAHDAKLFVLRLDSLPCGGIQAEACSHHVLDTGPEPRVVVNLVKAQPDAAWPSVGAVARPAKRPVVTVKDYTWCDEKMGVRIWVKVPGVHTCRPGAVAVRFRELSFDVTVADLGGKDYAFAVTELPMEVVVSECAYVVEADTVKVYLRKWARTGWQKLQLARASLVRAAVAVVPPAGIAELALSGFVVLWAFSVLALWLMWPSVLRALALRERHPGHDDADVVRRRKVPTERQAPTHATKAVDAAHPNGTPGTSDTRTVLQQHLDFFDADGKGFISPSDTYLGFRRIGYNIPFSAAAVAVIHLTFSMCTWPDLWPRLSLPIYLNRAHKTKHGSDSDVYDTEGRFTPQRFEEIFSKWATCKTSDGEAALSFSDIQDMLCGLMNVNDFVGWIAGRMEWWTLWYIAKDERGLLSKERVRACYDGTLWRQLEEIAIAKRGYDVAPNVRKAPILRPGGPSPAAEGRKATVSQDGSGK